MIHKPSILLIEPDDSLANKICMSLKTAGYNVTRSRDIAEGIKFVTMSPNLVVLHGDVAASQLEMPYYKIRQAAYTPIIVYGDEKRRAEVLESGADAYMNNPLNLGELIARVKSFLRRKESAAKK